MRKINKLYSLAVGYRGLVMTFILFNNENNYFSSKINFFHVVHFKNIHEFTSYLR